ncbi:MAG: 3-methyl-2-oxobutanoate hydroxymethyltransferase [Paludibacteraceae bacterium]|nr:3-methyl-2-oxobutanoate hydroxymethyltransferase [Candidatus Physcocola equi]MCQ2233386.1 3-methyl-2-oxobutanoate hydroxymethyltransferase [Paludibacteraceae bacterium]
MPDPIKKKVTTIEFAAMKSRGEKITMLTAYDYLTASIFDQAGLDSILVGDSASNVMQGNANTLPITVDEMIVYARSVVRACKRAMVICDMPFGSYQISKTDALANAVRIMKETGADALKLEGGEEYLDVISGIIHAGIPVCGHLGLTPQSVKAFGGFGVRAKEDAEAEKLIRDLKMLENAGCFAVVLEKIPAALAARATAAVRIPIIGIGAGTEVDGQVLVGQDLLGYDPSFHPKFVRSYANLNKVITEAVQAYSADVKSKNFPGPNEQY